MTQTIEKYLLVAFLFVFALVLLPIFTPPTIVKADQPTEPVLESAQPIITDSKFGSKWLTNETKIERDTVIKDDPEREYGEETVLEEGANGKKTIVTKITFYEGEEYSREIESTTITPAKDKIISKGTKIIWRTLSTPEGEIRYWRKMRVYATHYDQHCPGCNEWTAIGMRAGKGVIAVDPKVIKMRSQVYVPGYGKAIAGDTGGAIKGNIIDLGYEDARTAGWSARYVDIYLMDKNP